MIRGGWDMNLSREWYQSEFVNHEMLEAHRFLEDVLTYYKELSNGNVEFIEADNKRRSFTDPKGMGNLSEDPVRNMRYHFVVATAMVTRYCITAGLEQEKAYSLSDFYIMKMDKMSSIAEIIQLHDDMAIDFCQRMKELKSSQILSKPIILCIDYIYSHIHYRITIEELADYLNISTNYLSKLFKKEMGLPVSKYIIKLKIEKAKNLLQYSDYSIIEIATYLSFASQSHFIQVFEKEMGITPHKYRMKHFRTSWDNMGKQ